MRFSVWPNASQPWDEILGLAQHAESTGWDGVWIADHFMPNGPDVSGPTHECWSLLAALAASVPRVRLGALVSGNTYRHPAVLAKAVTTIDHVSGGGRVVLGLGAGWQENEHRAYGIEFFDTGTRLRRLEEACEIVKRLCTEPRVTFSGTHYSLEDAPLEPKPAGTLPLLVGGGGEKVTMRIAATWADEWNVWGTPDTLAAKGKVLEGHCGRLGRDPSTIARSAQALLFLSDDESWLAERRKAMAGGMAAMVGTTSELVDVVGAYAAAGVDELIVPDFTLGSGARKRDTLDRFLTEVAAPFRS